MNIELNWIVLKLKSKLEYLMPEAGLAKLFKESSLLERLCHAVWFIKFCEVRNCLIATGL